MTRSILNCPFFKERFGENSTFYTQFMALALLVSDAFKGSFMNKKGALIVSIDSVKSDKMKVKEGLATVVTLANVLELEPQAVMVLSPRVFSLPFDFQESLEAEFLTFGQNGLFDLMENCGMDGSIPSETLFQRKSSRSETIKCLLKNASEKNAKAIAVFTHVGKERSFAVPGSFISTLVSQSTVPVIAINAENKKVIKLSTILVATDFSVESELAFQKSIELALQAKAKLIIAHVIPTVPKETMMASSGMAGGWANVEAYLKAEEETMTLKGKKLVEIAQARGVVAQFQLLTGTLAVAKEIMETAKSFDVDILVLAERTGPWATLLLGSVTREILGQSSVPVFVVPIAQKGT